MKKTIFLSLLTASLILNGCQQTSGPSATGTPAPASTAAATETPGGDTATATPDAGEQAGFPFDIKAGELEAESGQFVFAPMASSVEEIVKGEDNSFSDMRPRELVKPGPETSVLKDGAEFEVPNELIITIPAEEKASVGDVVLGNPQYGSMEVAIVTEASDPAAPTVHFFRPVYGDDAPEGDKFNGKLEAGRFRVLDSELEPGTHALYPDGEEPGFGQVISLGEEKVLVTQFGGDLAVFDKSEVTPIPVKPGVKEGDKVQAPFGKGMDPATVSKVDDKIGRVWVVFDGREKQGESVFAYGEILPAQ